MINRSSTSGRATLTARALAPLALIAAFWIVSDAGYYFLLPALGVDSSYNNGPIAVSLYYLFWVGMAAIAFWPQYAAWSRHTGGGMFENRLTSSLIWTAGFLGAVIFAAYVLPALPPFDWQQPWEPPELPLASPWYFLPKSFDILFQQLLIVALVIAFYERGCSLRQVSTCCAALFGGMHVLLAFGEVPWGYAIRFVMLATAFGLVFPYLILRVRNGLAYSYAAHWGYYALSVLVAHSVGSGAALRIWNQLLGGSGG